MIARPRSLLAGALLSIACGRGGQPPKVTNELAPHNDGKPMQDNDEMQVVRNDRIQFATMRPPGSTMPTRDRQVMVIGPPEAVTLARRGDIAILDQLLPLLEDPDRAWAAEVMLAALTGNEADLVNDFQGSPDAFYTRLGQGAKARWQRWLDEVRGKLQWDATRRQFVVQ